jgi:hypothetical protein
VTTYVLPGCSEGRSNMYLGAIATLAPSLVVGHKTLEIIE